MFALFAGDSFRIIPVFLICHHRNVSRKRNLMGFFPTTADEFAVADEIERFPYVIS